MTQIADLRASTAQDGTATAAAVADARAVDRGQYAPVSCSPAAGHAIGYVVSRFPKLTETFILNELVEMERLGARVEIYPLLRQRDAVTQPQVGRLMRRARFVHVVSWTMLRAHWHFLSNRPLAYARVLWEVLSGTVGSARYFAGALIYFPKAVWFAYDAQRRAVAHIHAQFANHPALVALIVHRLTGIPFSFTARGSDIHVDRTMLKEKLAASRFSIAVSESNRDVMVAAGGQPAAEKIHVIYGGIDTDRFSPSRKSRSDEFRIVCVARFEEVKGHAQLVEACGQLRDRGVEFECDLVGDGEWRSRIEQHIAAAGLGRHVRLHGACAEGHVIEALSRATVFVLATVPARNGKREGIPNVLKEAMACGLPVVASRISGIPELVEHEQSGLLVRPNDVKALADALERVKSDPDLRARLGQAARARIVDMFDIRLSTRRRVHLFFGRDHVK
jgi:colanic acid/amylovoran biosynthesis glycosyltransferase